MFFSLSRFIQGCLPFRPHLIIKKKEKSYKKKQWRPPTKKKKGGKNLSPRNRKACHSTSTALLKSVAEMGIQSAMKSSRKTSPHLIIYIVSSDISNRNLLFSPRPGSTLPVAKKASRLLMEQFTYNFFD
jgi:hypothetical protein